MACRSNRADEVEEPSTSTRSSVADVSASRWAVLKTRHVRAPSNAARSTTRTSLERRTATAAGPFLSISLTISPRRRSPANHRYDPATPALKSAPTSIARRCTGHMRASVRVTVPSIETSSGASPIASGTNLLEPEGARRFRGLPTRNRSTPCHGSAVSLLRPSWLQRAFCCCQGMHRLRSYDLGELHALGDPAGAGAVQWPGQITALQVTKKRPPRACRGS